MGDKEGVGQKGRTGERKFPISDMLCFLWTMGQELPLHQAHPFLIRNINNDEHTNLISNNSSFG